MSEESRALDPDDSRTEEEPVNQDRYDALAYLVNEDRSTSLAAEASSLDETNTEVEPDQRGTRPGDAPSYEEGWREWNGPIIIEMHDSDNQSLEQQHEHNQRTQQQDEEREQYPRRQYSFVEDAEESEDWQTVVSSSDDDDDLTRPASKDQSPKDEPPSRKASSDKYPRRTGVPPGKSRSGKSVTFSDYPFRPRAASVEDAGSESSSQPSRRTSSRVDERSRKQDHPNRFLLERDRPRRGRYASTVGYEEARTPGPAPTSFSLPTRYPSPVYYPPPPSYAPSSYYSQLPPLPLPQGLRYDEGRRYERQSSLTEDSLAKTRLEWEHSQRALEMESLKRQLLTARNKAFEKEVREKEEEVKRIHEAKQTALRKKTEQYERPGRNQSPGSFPPDEEEFGYGLRHRRPTWAERLSRSPHREDEATVRRYDGESSDLDLQHEWQSSPYAEGHDRELLKKSAWSLVIKDHAEDSWPITGDDGTSENYDFDLNTTSRPSTSLQDQETLSGDSSPCDSNGRLTVHRFNAPMTTKRIARSRWLRDRFERGDLVGEISLDESPLDDAHEKSKAPGMRWYHLERPRMIFYEFVEAVESVLQAHEGLHHNVVLLLREAQTKYEQMRSYGRDMDPHCMSDTFHAHRGHSNGEMVSVKFLVFPYHCVEKYDRTRLAFSSSLSDVHPPRPILNLSTSRDIASAADSSLDPHGNKGLHVSELWCLIINDDTMVTCCKPDANTLCESTIVQMNTKPSEVGLAVIVTVPGVRSWHVPVSSTTSWPAFISLFKDMSTDNNWSSQCIQLEGESGVVDGRKWTDIVKLTSETAMPVRLQLKIVPPSKKALSLDTLSTLLGPVAEENSDNEVLSPSGSHERTPGGVSSSNAAVQEHSGAGLQMFEHANASSGLSAQADWLHKVRLSTGRSGDQRAYAACPSSSVPAIDQWLSSSEISNEGEQTDLWSDNRTKRRFALASKFVFHAFWPKGYSHPMVEKFWGAVYQVVSREGPFLKQKTLSLQDGFDGPRVEAWILGAIDGIIIPVLHWMTQQFQNSKKDLHPLPDPFAKAWLHFLTGIVILGQQPPTGHIMTRDLPVIKHLTATWVALNEGLNIVSTKLQFSSLKEVEVCTANGLGALLISRLSKGVIDDRRSVDDIYSDYYTILDTEIEGNPCARSHQDKLRYFMLEVKAILSTLEKQLSVLITFVESLDLAQQEDQRTHPTDTGKSPKLEDIIGASRQSALLNRTGAELRSKINNFRDLQSRAKSRIEWHRSQIETNKDRQESAIVVFTIVTIIFMPLSFVASVFGMNSSDIRNLELSQWVFWATALPLTLVVVVGSLWWAGFFGDEVGRRLYNTMRRSRRWNWDRQRYERLSDQDLKERGASLRYQRHKLTDFHEAKTEDPMKQGLRRRTTMFPPPRMPLPSRKTTGQIDEDV